MRKLLPALALMLSANVYASDFDLKATMKQMKVEFKQAAEATEIVRMQAAVDNLSDLVEQSKRGDYPPEKFDLYFEGFTKLSQALDAVDAKLEQGDLDAAKQELRQVDALREEYHDKRNPSIWSKLFG
ncbi:cytochrome b562 [Vibrio sp. MarTm2]|uniref:Cytochrome b562 family protein n=3 Tax=Vibrio TaxID=662 RepID=A0A0A5I1B0_PHOS4|nr:MULTISPECIES: cytochrome b562 [Vibrio]KGY10330.1 cytochrome b562 family protein [Vibrio sinaloensis]KHA59372.1 cytochrome b562 family protein [Vibrio variabilis]KHD25411.1 cytochrome b562 family protein [Vibrio caribbeanicus]KHT47624.1 cytochrome b562 family protein [Vibrio sinaloensis]KHT51591.1 cytochrome b562 family protein [Vibrio sinaloensis]